MVRNPQYADVPGVEQSVPEFPTPPPVVLDDIAYLQRVMVSADTWTYDFVITKVTCSIEVTISIDANGDAEISSWQSVPQDPACQRGDAGL